MGTKHQVVVDIANHREPRALRSKTAWIQASRNPIPTPRRARLGEGLWTRD